MNGRRFFLGVFLLSLGLILLMQRFNLQIFFSPRAVFAKYWPAISIGLGFYLLCNRGKSMYIAIISLFLILLLGAGLTWLENMGGAQDNYSRERDKVVIPRQVEILYIPRVWGHGGSPEGCMLE